MIVLAVFLLLVTTGHHVYGQTSRGTHFVVALPPSSHSAPVDTELIFNAREATSVTLSSSTTSITYDVPAMGSVSHLVREDMRVIDRLESKGLVVTSDLPITVHMASDHPGSQFVADGTILRPLPEDSTSVHYTPLATFERDSTTFDLLDPYMFYMVVAAADNTHVSVYVKQGGDFILQEEVQLDTYDVFTFDAGRGVSNDFTGGYVMSNIAVSVYSGNGRAGVVPPGRGYSPTHVMDAMPGANDLGTEYITFQNAGGLDREGYYIQVVSVTDNTTVDIPEADDDTTFTLDAGEFRNVFFGNSNTSTRVSCSSPCLVVEYGVEDRQSDSPTYMKTGAYMITLTPSKAYSRDLIFTTAKASTYADTTVLALVVEGADEPVTNLHLNDVNLDYLEWRTVYQSDYQYAMMLVDPDFYQLVSDDESRRFSAYLYSRWSYYVSSSFVIGYGG